MALFRETELKLRLANPSMYDQLISDEFNRCLYAENLRKETICENTYYDTWDRRLLSGGLTLRIRKTGTDSIATVKELGTKSAGLFIRGEWNQEVDDQTPSIAAFDGLPIGPALARLVGREALEPLIQTNFNRVSRLLTVDGATIEVSVDRGRILAGGRVKPFCEVEFELKSGEVASLFRLGAAFAKRYPLIVETESKFTRGLRLAGIDFRLNDEEQSPNVLKPALREVMTAHLLQAVQDVFIKQELLFDTLWNVAAVHDFRTSLRRLRALMSFVKPAMASPLYADLNAKLRALMNGFSQMRELDVLLESLFSADTNLSGKGISKLKALLLSERQKEREKVLDSILTCTATPPLLECCGAFIKEESWLSEAGSPFEAFADRRLTAWSEKLDKVLAEVSVNDLQQMHRLRILGKKIRTVQDVLLTNSEASRSMIQMDLKQFQTALGDQHDTARNIMIVKKLIKAHSAPALKRKGRAFIHSQKLKLKALNVEIRQNYIAERTIRMPFAGEVHEG